MGQLRARSDRLDIGKSTGLGFGTVNAVSARTRNLIPGQFYFGAAIFSHRHRTWLCRNWFAANHVGILPKVIIAIDQTICTHLVIILGATRNSRVCIGNF